MDEGSLVGAARVLDITQSAVSKHLAQLRDWLGDPLFVRTTHGMSPTPQASELINQVEKILEETNKLLAIQPQSPTEFAGVFTLSATDEVLQFIIPRLQEKMGYETPYLRLTCLPLATDYSIRQLETGAVNLLVAVNWHSPEKLKQKLLFRDQFVCVMHKDHPLAHAPFSLDGYTITRHVLVAPLGHNAGLVDQELAKHGLTRRVSISVPNFSLVTPDLLAKDAIITLPKRVALDLITETDLVINPCPMELEDINYFALWHERFDNEPKLRWMREAIANIYLSR